MASHRLALRLLSPCLLAAALTALPACGGGGSSTSKGEGELVTLGSLPEAERLAFEAWKLRPLKACAWEEAFPQLAEAYAIAGAVPAARRPAVDVPRFLEAIAETSGGLPLLAGPAGELVLFDAPVTSSAEETRDLEHSRNEDGRITTLRISSHRRNGECVLTLGGEEIFRAALADRLPVAAAYDPAEAPGEGVKVGAVEQATDHTAEGVGYVVGRTPGAPLLASATATLGPDDRTLALLAARFSLSAEHAQAIFARAGAGAADPAAAALVSTTTAAGTRDLSATTLFAPGQYVLDAAPVAERSALLALRDAGAARIDLFYAPAIGPAGALIRLEATIAVDAGADPVARLSAIRLGAARTRADADAARCFLSRYAAAGPFITATPRSFGAAYGGCIALAEDAVAALAGDPDATAVVVGEVARLGAQAPSYRSWDTTFLAVVDGMLTLGRPLAELDPAGIAPALTAHVPALEAYLEAVADAEARRALQRKLVVVSFDPYFSGRSLTGAQRADVRAALRKASAPFRDSTARMLTDLVRLDPSAGLAAAACGAALTDARTGAVLQAADAARAYLYGGGFADRLRGAALQACYTQGDLDAVATALTAARRQTSDEGGERRGDGWQAAHQALIDRALDERWTTAVFAAATDVMAFGVVSEYARCQSYATLSERAACAGALEDEPGPRWFSAAPGDALDPGFAGRYATLARDLQARFQGQLADDGTTRLTLQLAYFDDGGLWLGCGGEAFAARRAELFRLLDRLRGASGTARAELELDIDDLVGSRC